MDLVFWEIARASGLAAYAALCISVLSGLAPRTQALSFLANNRAVRALHDWTPWIIIPAALTHIVALLLDATARIGVLDVFVPFLTSYGQLAICLGTTSIDLLIDVLVTTWIRRRMSNNSRQWWHRVSYLGFVTMFLHSMPSATDLTCPVIAVRWRRRWVRWRRRWRLQRWRWRRRIRRRPARDVHRDMQQLRTRGARSVPATRRQARVLQRLLRAASPGAALLDAEAKRAEARQSRKEPYRWTEAAKGT